MPSTSLVIATYNWPEALELCLLSVSRQRILPDEVVIADDGSGAETKRIIEKYKAVLKIPVNHIWHPDTGFRLAQIRNKANSAASGDYIIQIDGDLVLHEDFVGDHINAAKPGHFIGGSRVILDKSLSDELLRDKKTDISIFKKGVTNHFNGIHSRMLGKLLSGFIKTSKAYNIRGCNMSYWKKDFVAVNGYNENYTGWGREDTDLVFRFYHSGLQRTFFKLRGVAWHLWHKEADRAELIRNDSILENTIQTKAVKTLVGVDQYIQSL